MLLIKLWKQLLLIIRKFHLIISNNWFYYSKNPDIFRQDLINIAKTTLSSKVLSQDKEYFAELAVDAVLRLKGSTNLDNIQIIKKAGGKLLDSYLDEGFILDKKIGVNQPKRIENANILVANTRIIFLHFILILTLF